MQRKFISRRSFLKCAGMGAVTAAAAGLLAGCGGSDSSSSSTASSAAAAEPADPNKPYAGVTLYYAATDTEATGPEMQDIVAMVKEKTGINIEFNIIPKADTGEVDKRLVSLQAGDALDIVYGTVAQLKVFYDAGVLEPLDELASAANYDIKSVFGDSAPVYDDGQTYGLPAFTDVWCTFINTKVFENAGVEIPSAEGWTWEKYIETAQKLTNLDEEIYGSLMLDYDCYNYMYALQNGAEHYKEDGTSNYDDPRFRDSVEFFYSLGNELQIQPDITTYKAGVYPWNAFPSTGVANADGTYDKAQFGMFVCGGWAASMLPDTDMPRYIIFKNIGILNTMWSLILPAAVDVYFVFLLRQAFVAVPEALSEAARIDGCSHFTIYRRIILPLCMPQVSTMLLFSFVWSWNDYMGPYLYISDINKQMISVGIKLFASGLAQDYGAQMAGATLVLIPVIVAFFLCQKYFVEGITAGAVKG